MSSPFHEGELELQKKFDSKIDPEKVKRVIRTEIIDNVVPFIESQSTLIISSLDLYGNIWTSMLIGENKFLKVKSSKKLVINLDVLKSTRDDITFSNLKERVKVGILIINAEMRIRFRINGYATLSNNYLEIDVLESYPNCPKYIQQRVVKFENRDALSQTDMTSGIDLKPSQIELIKNADTFFLGSVSGDGNMDASHRGGKSGFIQLLENNVLKIPDYVGNNLYNTFGNFLQNPKCGLLFIDYKSGLTLHITGEVEFLFDQTSNTDLSLTTNTGRFWLFRPKQWVEIKNHHRVEWKFLSYSPFNP